MKCHRRIGAAVCVAVASLFVLCGRAAAEGFNPQPEPPGSWYVEGFIDMWAEAVDPTSAAMPFGIDQGIVGDTEVDFSAGVIARFLANTTADGKPVDGEYVADFEYFQVQIGDSNWDETLPNTGVLFQVANGLVSGMSANITCTMPAHPDLEFWLPASPGLWEARDIRDDLNLGTIAGTYALRDGTVPEPGTLPLLAIGALTLVFCRQVRGSRARKNREAKKGSDIS